MLYLEKSLTKGHLANYTIEKNSKMAILKLAVICFFTKGCYKVIPFQ